MSLSEAILPIVDAIAALPTLPSGMTLDGAGALPQEYQPDKLYAAPLFQRGNEVDTGQSDEAHFYVRLAVSVNAQGEDGGKLRLRAVSNAEEAGVLAILNAVLANRAKANLWEWLKVTSVAYNAVAQQDCRVAWVDVEGYRLVLVP